ncbi:hypothetical protein DFH28DRAFT_930646 [Melampsora americana]|nr:hypothetical protein DFH28DRAFT_930646 [Melampsora americana]
MKVPFHRFNSKPTQSNPILPNTQDLLSQIKLIISNRPKQNIKPSQPIQESNQTQLKLNWSTHQLHTKWSLYKHLIIQTRSLDSYFDHPSSTHHKDVLFKDIQSQFRKNRSLTSLPQIQNSLRLAYSYLNLLIKSNPSLNPSSPSTSASLNEIQKIRSDLIEDQNQISWSKIYQSYYKSIQKKPLKPIMTGRLLRPTVLNKPLPRYANQPLHISMMIASRRKSNEKRRMKEIELMKWMRLDELDHEIETDLPNQSIDRSFYEERLNEIKKTYQLNRKRERTVYSTEMLNEINLAKRRRPKDLQEYRFEKRLKERLNRLNSISLVDPDDSDPIEKSIQIQTLKFWSE